eukprot:6025080-Pyramimonas_sp.AAC.1
MTVCARGWNCRTCSSCADGSGPSRPAVSAARNEAALVKLSPATCVFREHSGNVQGTFRTHSGNIQGTLRKYHLLRSVPGKERLAAAVGGDRVRVFPRPRASLLLFSLHSPRLLLGLAAVQRLGAERRKGSCTAKARVSDVLGARAEEGVVGGGRTLISIPSSAIASRVASRCGMASASSIPNPCSARAQNPRNARRTIPSSCALLICACRRRMVRITVNVTVSTRRHTPASHHLARPT